MYLHSVNGVPQVAAPVPIIGAPYRGLLYERYDIRFQAAYLPGYYAAWLLWPDSGSWNQGEIDFPEGGLGGTINAFVHQPGPQPFINAFANNTGVMFASGGWHTATTEWTKAGVTFYLDGR